MTPQKMSSPLNSLTRESTACMTVDRKIYFSSNREGNGLADLYCSSLENGAYLSVEYLEAINTVRDEESIFISPNDTYTIFSRYATNEYGPDLWISYRDITGSWIQPIPIDSTINTADWERRPFVTIDNQYLLFTRMAFSDKGLEESDIYWVNTQKVFKPFVYHPLSDITAKIGTPVNILIPTDYFKDIDGEHITLSVNADAIEWLQFDKEKMFLSGVPTREGAFELVFTAVDEFSNRTEERIKLTVTN